MLELNVGHRVRHAHTNMVFYDRYGCEERDDEYGSEQEIWMLILEPEAMGLTRSSGLVLGGLLGGSGLLLYTSGISYWTPDFHHDSAISGPDGDPLPPPDRRDRYPASVKLNRRASGGPNDGVCCWQPADSPAGAPAGAPPSQIYICGVRG